MIFFSSISQADEWSRAQIDFWKRIYTVYSGKEWVIHDSMNLRHVYRVVSSDPDAAKKEVSKVLKGIYDKNKSRKTIDVEGLTDVERSMFEVLEANEDPRSYDFASDLGRIRAQQGLKDQLDRAVILSRKYLGRMEEMFIEEGVPKEITRLPFVESCFVNEACSVSGAIGIWQFMPKTAMKDLRVDQAIDERYDPLKSTRAAARFLKENHRILKNWNLSVMAYHHGAGLVSKAMKRLKTEDPYQIIRFFKDPRFKFASRNYLFEWQAMVEIDSEAPLEPLPEFITVSFPKKMTIGSVIQHLRLQEKEIRLLNPHFREPIWSGKSLIPAHYPVRLTGITLEEFRKRGYSL